MVGDSDICERLVKKRWVSYEHGLQKAPKKKPVIYVIGEKMDNGRIENLYGGQSDDFYRRVREHTRQNLAIDNFIKKQYRKNRGKNLRVKWELNEKSNRKEGQYIQCIKKITGDKLIYNRKKGNSASSRIKRVQEDSLKALLPYFKG